MGLEGQEIVFNLDEDDTYLRSSLKMLKNLCHHMAISEDKFKEFKNHEAIISSTVTFKKRTRKMPLIKGAKPNSKGFKKNIETEMAAGKPQKQAVAIAYSEARRGKKSRKK